MSHPERSREIAAAFGGRSVIFRLEQGAHWAAVINTWIGAPLPLYHRLVAGNWTAEDLRSVLALAYVGSPGRALRHVVEVEDVLEREPAGTFALLVLRILEAYLFGIPAAIAVFDERDPFAEAVA